MLPLAPTVAAALQRSSGVVAGVTGTRLFILPSALTASPPFSQGFWGPGFCRPWSSGLPSPPSLLVSFLAQVLKGHDDHVITCLQFCGNRIVSGSDDNTLKVWSAVTGEVSPRSWSHHRAAPLGGMLGGTLRGTLVLCAATAVGGVRGRGPF